MEASLKSKMPLRPKLGYTPTKGTLGICLHNTIGWMPGNRTLRSLNASLAIPTRILGLRPRLCGSTVEPGDFLVNHRKPHELDVASVNHHS
jgi:hypothetical protein